MAKKRKRSQAGGDSSANFGWKKVEVGLSSSKNDDDFEEGENQDNHYDVPSSAVYRSAERELEASPNEDMGIFLGLEVLDGSQYDIVGTGANKRMVPKQVDEYEGDEEHDEEKGESISESTNTQDAATSNDKEEPGSDAKEESDEKQQDSAANPKKKKKKKRKKKKLKESSTEEPDDTNNEDKDATRLDQTEGNTGNDEKSPSAANNDDAIDDNKDPQVESLQSAWMVATGGVTLQERLCLALLKQDFWNPTPIQAASLPAAILGRRNIVGAAPTGSGKTLAYLLPIFEFLLQQQPEPQYEERKVQALILAPTRELALQVQGECNKLVKGKCGILVGGMAAQKQERVLRTKKPPIIIATPGRLWEMISSREHDHLNDLSQISFLVIDECDRMTEQGSFPQLHSILDAVEKANPMDADDDDEEDDGDDGQDEDDPDRLRSLPGVKGEAKVVMLSDEVLAMINKQKNGEQGTVPEPIEMDDVDFDDAVAAHDADDFYDDVTSEPGSRPTQRQTFVYSATLTLPPSASYIPSRNKRKKMINLKGLEGAIEEILDKARVSGQTKVIDLSNSKKQAKFNEKILAAKEQKQRESITKSWKEGIEATQKRKFNLPPGLKLQEIQCTQMHKDSHLYAYLVTTQQGASGPCLIFCNSIKAVKRVGNTLKTLGLPVRMLHAQMQQRARFRSVESLQSETRAVVVATDVAARGLDIPNVATVVHYDVARKVDGFVHRAGRTARGMGEKAVGSSLSLISPAEDRAHRKIVSELKAVFNHVNLDSRLLASAQERTNLASKIIAVEHIEGKAQRDNQWFLQSAKDAGLEIDDDMLDDGLAGGNLKEQHQLREAKRAKELLQGLLAQPMVTQRYGKFLSSHQVASKAEVTPFVVQAKIGKSKRKRRKG